MSQNNENYVKYFLFIKNLISPILSKVMQRFILVNY